MGRRRGSTTTAFSSVFGWIRKQSKKVQAALAASIAIGTIVTLHFFMDSDYFYVFSEVMETIANLILVYKLTKHKNCAGISLRTQEVTAIFVAARLLSSLTDDIGLELHLVLDSVSLIATCFVIYMMRFKLQSTYAKELDNMSIYYLVVPCFILALIVNPGDLGMPWLTFSFFVLWAFSTYVEAVAVLPQLRLIQNAKIVEPFTAHYVFALGLSRFFGFGHWAVMIYETGGKSLLMIGARWFLWFAIHLLAEIVQTFILADFCYYYVKSVMRGQQMMLPLPA